MEKWSNLLIDFRLAGDRHTKPASKLHLGKRCSGARSARRQGCGVLMRNERR